MREGAGQGWRCGGGIKLGNDGAISRLASPHAGDGLNCTYLHSKIWSGRGVCERYRPLLSRRVSSLRGKYGLSFKKCFIRRCARIDRRSESGLGQI